MGGAASSKGFDVIAAALERLDPGIVVVFAGSYPAPRRRLLFDRRRNAQLTQAWKTMKSFIVV